jgi:shikimate kinase
VTSPSRPIFLVGCRGAGKTTVAERLARRLGWDWIDADQEIESRLGCSIVQAFEQAGESAFRDLEEQIFRELCLRQRHVVATGGGLVLRASNRERLRASGSTIWLTADPPTLWQRLQKDPATAARRPPLAEGGRAEVERTLNQRAPLYQACADYTVSTMGRGPDEVVADIMAVLGLRPEAEGSPCKA